MGKPINKTVGECECPIKGCDLIGQVRRIKNEGDFYLDCSQHGTIRNKGTHEYILGNAGLFNPDGSLPPEKITDEVKGREVAEAQDTEVVKEVQDEDEKAEVISIDKNKKADDEKTEKKSDCFEEWGW